MVDAWAEAEKNASIGYNNAQKEVGALSESEKNALQIRCVVPSLEPYNSQTHRVVRCAIHCQPFGAYGEGCA